MRIFPSGIEGASCIVSFIILPIIKLKNILLDHKLEQTSEYIRTSCALGSLHYLEKFRKFKERVQSQLLYFHGKHLQNGR
jgi:hypothetical protein